MPLRRLAGALLLAWLSAAAAAGETGTTVASPAEPSAAIPQPEAERFADAIRSRLAMSTDPRLQWLAGQLDRGDIESQVRHFAAARIAAPGNKLYLGTLATACLERVRPRLSECEKVDRLADWATRDVDNGLPSLLLADRSRRYGHREDMLAHLGQAAALRRFDDYSSAATLEVSEALRSLAGPGDDVPWQMLAIGHALPSPYPWWEAWGRTCNPTGEFDEALRTVCRGLGKRMFEQGSSWASRAWGAGILVRTAPTAEVRTTAERERGLSLARFTACATALDTIRGEVLSADGAIRAQARREWDRWIRRSDALGAVDACEEIAAKK